VERLFEDIDEQDLTFDQALTRLEELSGKLEQGDIPLEDALEVYERAVGLFALCRDRLDGMEQRIEKLTEDLDGTLRTEPTGEGEPDAGEVAGDV